MSVGYNPWTGWGYGVSWSSGPVTFTVGVSGWGGYYGWYGPYGYRPPYYPYPPRPGVPPGYLPPGAGIRPGARPGAPGVAPHSSNLYASQQNRSRNASTPGSTSAAMADRAARGGANNVFADRNGDVYRRNTDGTWERRGENGWSRPDARQGSYQGPSSLERDHLARQHGSSRVGTYQGTWGGAGRGFSGGRRR